MKQKTKTNDTQRNVLFAVLLCGCIVGSIIQTALATVLPVIMTDLSIDATTAQWLTTVFTLAMGVMIPITPFLIKQFSMRVLFIFTMLTFIIGLGLAAIPTSFGFLLFGRVLQAIATGSILSLTQVTIFTVFPVEKRGSIMGIYGLAAGAAPVLAPTISGIVVDHFSWHVIFMFATIISLIVLLFGLKIMPNTEKQAQQNFDVYSVILSSTGFSGLLLAVGNSSSQAFFSWFVGVPLIVGCVAIFLFVFRQLKIAQPFLDLRVFSNFEFTLSVIASMLLYAVMMAGSILLPIYLQTLRGFSATLSGLITMPGSLAMMFANPFAGRLYDKYGIRQLFLVGSLLMFLSCISLSFLSMQTSAVWILVAFVIRLLGIGLMMMPLNTWGMSTLGVQQVSDGTAILTSLRTIAGSISAAIFMSIMSAFGQGAVTVRGINGSFKGVAVVAIIELALAFWLYQRKKSKQIDQVFS